MTDVLRDDDVGAFEGQTVSVQIVGRAAPIFRIVELENPTAAQRTLRERWLRP